MGNGLPYTKELLSVESWDAILVGKGLSPFQFNGTDGVEPCSSHLKTPETHRAAFAQIGCMLGLPSACPGVVFTSPKTVVVFLDWVGPLTHILTLQWAGQDEYFLFQSWVGEYDLWEWINQEPGPRDWPQKSPYWGGMDSAGLARYLSDLAAVTSGERAWFEYKSLYEDLFWHAFDTPESVGVTCGVTSESNITAGIAFWEHRYDPAFCEYNVGVYDALCPPVERRAGIAPCERV